jgi:hypothetical protein
MMRDAPEIARKEVHMNSWFVPPIVIPISLVLAIIVYVSVLNL